MKKTFSIILALATVFCCISVSFAAAGCSSATAQAKNTPASSTATQIPTTTTPSTANNEIAATLPAPIAPQDLAFDVNVDEPQMPWPITRLGYEVYVDYPFSFETTNTTDGLTGKPINWTPVDPVTLYQLANGSWSSTAPSDIPSSELQARQFYLVEPGNYYRIIANYGGRTQNITGYRFYSSAEYSLDNVYSGLLKSGRTGCISLELSEYINGVSIIHRSRAYIASVEGASFMPKAYASNINGDMIITYYPTTATDRKDYYTDANIDLILPERAMPIGVNNVLY